MCIFGDEKSADSDVSQLLLLLLRWQTLLGHER